MKRISPAYQHRRPSCKYTHVPTFTRVHSNYFVNFTGNFTLAYPFKYSKWVSTINFLAQRYRDKHARCSLPSFFSHFPLLSKYIWLNYNQTFHFPLLLSLSKHLSISFSSYYLKCENSIVSFLHKIFFFPFCLGDRPENFRDIPAMMTMGSSSSSSSLMNSGMGYHQQMQQDVGGGSSSSLTTTTSLVDPISFSNGTLYIHSVRKSHHGYYLCEASNGIASGLSKVIRLVVNGKYVFF